MSIYYDAKPRRSRSERVPCRFTPDQLAVVGCSTNCNFHNTSLVVVQFPLDMMMMIRWQQRTEQRERHGTVKLDCVYGRLHDDVGGIKSALSTHTMGRKSSGVKSNGAFVSSLMRFDRRYSRALFTHRTSEEQQASNKTRRLSD